MANAYKELPIFPMRNRPVDLANFLRHGIPVNIQQKQVTFGLQPHFILFDNVKGLLCSEYVSSQT